MSNRQREELGSLLARHRSSLSVVASLSSTDYTADDLGNSVAVTVVVDMVAGEVGVVVTTVIVVLVVTMGGVLVVCPWKFCWELCLD